MATEIITSFQQVCDANGDPMSGAKVYVYDVGTTTLKSVWSDTALSAAAANPIVCDSAGRHDMRYIATGSYKIVVKTSADITVYTRDNIDGRVPVGSGALAIANGGTSATTAGAALTALGGATAAELADVAADVAALSGTLASSEKTHIATGTTAQRPASPIEGDIRRNTTTTEWEFYNGSTWQNVFTESDIATQANMETATSLLTVVTPGRVNNHPGVAKAWGYITFSAGTPTATASHNVTSLTDNGPGDVTVNLTTAFSSTSYAVAVTFDNEGGADGRLKHAVVQVKATGSIRIRIGAATGNADTTVTLADSNFHFMAFGDQ